MVKLWQSVTQSIRNISAIVRLVKVRPSGSQNHQDIKKGKAISLFPNT